jgi:hypothetical protein
VLGGGSSHGHLYEWFDSKGVGAFGTFRLFADACLVDVEFRFTIRTLCFHRINPSFTALPVAPSLIRLNDRKLFYHILIWYEGVLPDFSLAGADKRV